jgi:hypothetical protein
MKLSLKKSNEIKKHLMLEQKREIEKLYNDWADDLLKRANYLAKRKSWSSQAQSNELKLLSKDMREKSKQVANNVYLKIKSNVNVMSEAVVNDHVEWLKSLGFDELSYNMMFKSVNTKVVNNVIRGDIYSKGWSLSKAIWGDNEKALKDIYQVVAKGIAENTSVYEIAKELENYVRPNAKISWNTTGKDGVKIYKKKVDYNAQRLARTLIQHSYQQSIIESASDNPFIEQFIWHSNGSRACPICQARDGKKYSKFDLPMDHPNGMCIMEPVVDTGLEDKIAGWIKAPEGTFPKIDLFAKKFM